MLLYFTGTGNCLYAAKRRLRPLIFFSSMMFASPCIPISFIFLG